MRRTVLRQPEGPDRPTQFALVPPGRLVYLIVHYEAIRDTAEHLPPGPDRPPIAYVEATLDELRRELVAREHGTVAA